MYWVFRNASKLLEINHKKTTIAHNKTAIMKEMNNLIRVYTGTEVTVLLLLEELEKNGIPGIIQNDFNSGVMAGFSAGTSSAVDLFIQEIDLKKAEPLISGFMQINKV